jgi:hypothetical protein
MKTIIAGSRTIHDYSLVLRAVAESGFPITEVFSGAAAGVDTLGRRFAYENRLPCRLYPAEWGKYGKSAGLIRNHEMAAFADACIVIWDGQSYGSQHMIEIARKCENKIYVLQVQTPTLCLMGRTESKVSH